MPRPVSLRSTVLESVIVSYLKYLRDPIIKPNVQTVFVYEYSVHELQLRFI